VYRGINKKYANGQPAWAGEKFRFLALSWVAGGRRFTGYAPLAYQKAKNDFGQLFYKP
jgi:hypothetical protein